MALPGQTSVHVLRMMHESNMMFDSVKCRIKDTLYRMDNNYDLDSTILKDCEFFADVLIVLHEDVLVNRTSPR